MPRDHRYQIDDVTIHPNAGFRGLAYGFAIVFVLYSAILTVALLYPF